MTLGLNSRTRGSETEVFWVPGRVIRELACRSGVVLALAISGCAGHSEPQMQYVRVKVPVSVPCRAPEVSVPAWATASLRKTDSLEVKVRALLAERRQHIGYEQQLEAAVQSCR